MASLLESLVSLKPLIRRTSMMINNLCEYSCGQGMAATVTLPVVATVAT